MLNALQGQPTHAWPVWPGSANEALQDLSGGVTQALLDELDQGVLACDASARVQLCNFAASLMCAGAGPLRVAEGVLKPAHAGDQAGLRDAIRGAIVEQRRHLLELGGPNERGFVVVMPLRGNGAAGRLALLLLGRQRICAALSLDMLACKYALTGSERRVLGALLEDRSPAQVAQEHGVELSTVRTQIGSLRAKLGVASIDALIRLAARLPGTNLALRCVPGVTLQ